MKLVKQDVGVWTDPKLDPPDNGYYCIRFLSINNDLIEDACEYYDGDFYMQGDKGHPSNIDKIHSWLKPLPQVYVLTEEELEDLIKIRDKHCYYNNEIKRVDIKDFLESITK